MGRTTKNNIKSVDFIEIVSYNNNRNNKKQKYHE